MTRLPKLNIEGMSAIDRSQGLITHAHVSAKNPGNPDG